MRQSRGQGLRRLGILALVAVLIAATAALAGAEEPAATTVEGDGF